MINVNQRTIARKNESAKNPPFPQLSGLVTGIDNWEIKTHQNTWRPPTDIVETDTAFIIKVEIAGMDKSDFSITIEDTNLTISGSRQGPNPNGEYHQMEILAGFFSTSVKLKSNIDIHLLSAQYQDGFLTVILSKIN